MSKTPNWTEQYDEPQRAALLRSARLMLGSELVIQLNLSADADEGLEECIVDTREHLVALVSRVLFYPAQEPDWQAKLDKAGVAGKPGHLWAGQSNGHPHLLAVLERGPNATTDPLVKPQEVIVTKDGRTVQSRKMKAFFVDDAGIPANQHKRATRAMNGAHIFGETSPIQITRSEGVHFDHDTAEVPALAHADLQGDFPLSAAAMRDARALLLGRWQQLHA